MLKVSVNDLNISIPRAYPSTPGDFHLVCSAVRNGYVICASQQAALTSVLDAKKHKFYSKVAKPSLLLEDGGSRGALLTSRVHNIKHNTASALVQVHT